MSEQLAVVLVLLAVAIVMFVINKPRMDAVALIITPVSSPVNTLVVTPGNYTFGDFVRVGTPFALIVLIVTVVLVPWLLPL